MSLLLSGILGIAGQVGAGIMGVTQANIRKDDATTERKLAEANLANLEKNRQEVINPYENVTDLSSMLSNPMANLGVATQAAEMQIEQADISLANTLDTIRATGASAGGATALAQAALQSKKGVSASIEQQEAQNEKLKAQGEDQLQRMRMSEAQRVQQAEASGKQFMFGAQERRDEIQLDRMAGQIENAQEKEALAEANRVSAITGALGGATSVFGSMVEGGAFTPDEEGNLDYGLPFLNKLFNRK